MTPSQLRGAMKLSEAAKHLGISKSYLSLLENGKRRLNIDIANKLALLYEVGIEQIVDAYSKCRH